MKTYIIVLTQAAVLSAWILYDKIYNKDLSLSVQLNETLLDEKIERSMSQLLDEKIEKSMSQLLDEKIERSMSQLLDEKIERSMSQLLDEKIERSMSQLLDEKIERSMSQLLDEKIEKSMSQLLDEKIERSMSQLLDEKIERSMSQLLDEKIERSMSQHLNDQKTRVADVDDNLERVIKEAVETKIKHVIEERSDIFQTVRTKPETKKYSHENEHTSGENTASEREKVHGGDKGATTESINKGTSDHETGSDDTQSWKSWISYIYLIIYRLIFCLFFCFIVCSIMAQGNNEVCGCLAFILLSPCGLNPLVLFDVCLNTRDERGDLYIHVNLLMFVYRLLWLGGLAVIVNMLQEMTQKNKDGLALLLMILMPILLLSGLNPYVFFT